MSLPSFICIGAQKAGTTWLYEILSQNPGIWLPPLKEVHFFDRMGEAESAKEKRREHILKRAQRLEKNGGIKGSEGADEARFLRNLVGQDVGTEQWYRKMFSHPDATGRVSGEITPAYLTLPEDKIAYAKSLLPDAKFVLIVREPLARALSQIKMEALRSGEALDDPAWQQLIRRIKKTDRGNYSEFIPRWQRLLAPEQLLVLPFSLIKTDPAGMIRTIETFIGAPAYDNYKQLTETVHQTKPVAVPDWVSERLAALMEPQKQYLIDTFGLEFYEKTG
ncbi:sulfotransferase [Rhizobium sp. KVB221]|uniref:Sulfotransferase n=1 Tax=Rhizobium setariae TaxID=2801340 RepID=A0A936YRF8_9HYPH|nr:sulfotransferase [Rhizobium setariae]MBL0370980.1 sulfotransferase [Rhizobium setariae]